jgi:hypothetical protein
MRDNSSCTNYGVRSQLDAGKNDRIHTEPAARADDDRTGRLVTGGILDSMVRGDDAHVRRYESAATNHDPTPTRICKVAAEVHEVLHIIHIELDGVRVVQRTAWADRPRDVPVDTEYSLKDYPASHPHPSDEARIEVSSS